DCTCSKSHGAPWFLSLIVIHYIVYAALHRIILNPVSSRGNLTAEYIFRCAKTGYIVFPACRLNQNAVNPILSVLQKLKQLQDILEGSLVGDIPVAVAGRC